MVLTVESVASKPRFRRCAKKAEDAALRQAKEFEKQMFRP
jgi:hypothetical protein